MQRIARELNLSETAFVLPSSRETCAARVRIFTPAQEMRFAGHPTIGTSDVLVHEGIVSPEAGRFTLEELVGDVPIRIEPGLPPTIWLTTPPIEFGRTYEREACASALGVEPGDLLSDIPPQRLSAGNPTAFVPLRDKAAVDRAWIELAGIRALSGTDADPTCFFVFTPVAEGAYSRMFAPEHGVAEDPATGSSMGPLAAYMMRHGLIASRDGTRFVSEQGTKMGRRSYLQVLVHGHDGRDGIEVGGTCVKVIDATLTLPIG